ncbi:hypothetical protein [Methylocystis parvus]|uniref:hypothetical protein n=1 Tax=Methylocystis parvus TaxID=134 RepID=UPI003C707774
MISRVFIDSHRNAPATVRQQAQKKNAALYDKARSLLAKAQLPSATDFGERVAAGAPAHLHPVLCDIAAQLYQAEGFDPGSVPAPPPIPESIEAARYRDDLSALIDRIADPNHIERFETAVTRVMQLIVDSVPRIQEGPFTVGLLDVVPEAGRLIEQVAEHLSPVSKAFRDQYDENRCAISHLPFTKEGRASPKLVRPSAYSGPAREAVEAFFKGTPLSAIADARLPFDFPEAQRGEHWHLLGGSGHGKTQTLSRIIINDLSKPNPPALIIIDSQNQMLRQIQRLSLFDPDSGPLTDRLVIIDPEDDASPALNMFAMTNTRLGGYSRVNREIVEGDILQLFNYIFASLASELSTQMGTAFAYVTRLMLSIRPTATIHTLLDFLEEDVRRADQSKYFEHIAALDSTARGFFEKQFYKNATFVQTRSSLARRLHDVIKTPAFERMFAARQNRLSMFEAIQRKSIICVNTSDALLKDASPLFGRYMIASTMAAIFERVAIPKTEWHQAYLVIDEAASYFDESLEKLLRKARQYKLGVLFAHQLMDDLKSSMRGHVSSNTSIKMCGGIGAGDARQLASDFRCSPDFLLSQIKDNRVPENPQWSNWACYIQNLTPRAVSLRVPFHALRDAPKMSEASYQELLERNRAHYAADTAPEPSAPEAPASPTAPDATSSASLSTGTPPRSSKTRPRRDPDA